VKVKSSLSGDCKSLGLSWGISGMQGWRPSMEDAHFAHGPLGSWADTAAFSILDGHGGSQVAQFCESYLPGELAAGPHDDLPLALVSAFHKMDEMLRSSWHINAEAQGCAALVCCVRGDSIVAANAGDCRAVISRAGWAVELTRDHKPDLGVERQRIEKAGGFVAEYPEGPSRVNGWLSLSRAIGDLQFKDAQIRPEDQIICATPEIQTILRQPDHEFMVLACDGVWDVRSSQDVVTFIRSRLTPGASKQRLSEIVEELLDSCVSHDLAETRGLGGDNMSAMIVQFDNAHVQWGAKHVLGWLGIQG